MPIHLAQEIDRILSCAELLPVIGADARRARSSMHVIDAAMFAGAPQVDGPECGDARAYRTLRYQPLPRRNGQ